MDGFAGLIAEPVRDKRERSASCTAAAAGLGTATAATPNSAAWLARTSGWAPPAARATTRNRPGLRRTMSSAWVPIEPVEPRITTSRGARVWPATAGSVGITGPLSDTRPGGRAAALTLTSDGGPVPPNSRSRCYLQVMSQRPRGGDDRLAGDRLALRAEDRLVRERGRLELTLDAQRQRVADPIQPGQRLIGGQVPAVPGRVALDRRGVGFQCVISELADTGIELLVASSQAGDARAAKRMVRAGQDLGDHPAVMLVVVPEAGQVHQRGPDVGLVGPRAGGAAVRDHFLAAVRPGGIRALVRRQALEPELPDAWPDEADVVRVDLGGVVAVVPRVLVVDRHAIRGVAGTRARDAIVAGRRALLQVVVGLGELGQGRPVLSS